MEIKRNILFFPDKEKGKPDAKLRLRIRWEKKVVNFNVGHRINPDKWNKDAQRCSRNTTNLKKVSASVINSDIQNLHDKAENVFKAFEVSQKNPTVEQYRLAFNASIGRQKSNQTGEDNFFSLIEKFTSEMGNLNNWTKATYEKFSAVKSHLESFDSDLTFAKLNEEGLMAYVIHLRDVKGLRNTTIKKQIGFLKWFLRWAVSKNYNKELAFESFNPKLKTSQKEIIYLHWDELLSVYNKSIPDEKKYLERVRDVFCFCCFSSLRYSDVANLKRSDIYENHIEITTIKTCDRLRIDLNDYSKALLDKYKDSDFLDNLVFPIISNQKMNDYLKELAKLCELDREITLTYFKGSQRFDDVQPLHSLLSTHAGRRTFISHALTLGIPAEVVMKWTGHSDYKAMKPYIEIADKVRAENMKLFNK